MSIEDVKGTIREDNQALDQAKATIEKAGTSLADATSLALATLHDSSHEHASEACDLLAAALRKVDPQRGSTPRGPAERVTCRGGVPSSCATAGTLTIARKSPEYRYPTSLGGGNHVGQPSGAGC